MIVVRRDREPPGDRRFLDLHVGQVPRLAVDGAGESHVIVEGEGAPQAPVRRKPEDHAARRAAVHIPA